MRWYVYRVHIAGKLVYVGKGCRNRYLQSAKRIGGIAGIVRFFHQEQSAFKAEKRLVADLRPILNKTAGGEGPSLSPRECAKRESAKVYKKLKSPAAGPLEVLFAVSHWRTDMRALGRDTAPYDKQMKELLDAAMNYRCYRRGNELFSLSEVGKDRWLAA